MKEKTYILAQYDISGIQNYIFATNRLRENVGASINVGRILKLFLPEAIKTVAGTEVTAITDWELVENGEFLSESNPDILAEVLYIGGGNAVVVYRSRQLYDDVSKALAIKVAENCQGITVLSAFVETGLGEYSDKITELEEELSELKRRVPREVPMSPWPIVEQDPVYGLPVTRMYEKDGVSGSISEIQYEKYEASYREDTNENTSFRFALQMEELIEKRGEDSYVAVVHIDGNGMGDMVHGIRNRHKDFKSAVPAMRKMSAAISQTYKETFEGVVGDISRSAGREVLPIRPLIMDGDDITIICGARFALPTVITFLRRLMDQASEELPVTACAGIAFVHSHFPFSIAYKIAEACCSEAKKSWYKNGAEQKKTGYLDYQVVQGGYKKEKTVQRAESDIRKQPYRVSQKADNSSDDSIDFLNLIQNQLVQEKNGMKIWPRNRLKKLYEAFLKGPQEVECIRREFSARGYELSDLAAGMKSDEFNSARIYDALELMDFYDKSLYDEFFRTEGQGGKA